MDLNGEKKEEEEVPEYFICLIGELKKNIVQLKILKFGLTLIKEKLNVFHQNNVLIKISFLLLAV